MFRRITIALTALLAAVSLAGVAKAQPENGTVGDIYEVTCVTSDRSDAGAFTPMIRIRSQAAKDAGFTAFPWLKVANEVDADETAEKTFDEQDFQQVEGFVNGKDGHCVEIDLACSDEQVANLWVSNKWHVKRVVVTHQRTGVVSTFYVEKWIESSSPFSKNATGTGWLQATKIKAEKAVAIGDGQEMPQTVRLVKFFDNVNAPASPGAVVKQAWSFGSQVSFSKTTSKTTKKSLTLGWSSPETLIGSVNAEATTAFTKVTSNTQTTITTEKYGKEIELNYDLPERAFLIKQFNLDIPWNLQNYSFGMDQATKLRMKALNGFVNLSSLAGTSIVIPNRVNGKVKPLHWNDIDALIDIMEEHDPASAKKVRAKKQGWLDKGWVYEGDVTPFAWPKIKVEQDGKPGPNLTVEWSTNYTDAIPSLSEELRAYEVWVVDLKQWPNGPNGGLVKVADIDPVDDQLKYKVEVSVPLDYGKSFGAKQDPNQKGQSGTRFHAQVRARGPFSQVSTFSERAQVWQYDVETPAEPVAEAPADKAPVTPVEPLVETPDVSIPTEEVPMTPVEPLVEAPSDKAPATVETPEESTSAAVLPLAGYWMDGDGRYVQLKLTESRVLVRPLSKSLRAEADKGSAKIKADKSLGQLILLKDGDVAETMALAVENEGRTIVFADGGSMTFKGTDRSSLPEEVTAFLDAEHAAANPKFADLVARIKSYNYGKGKVTVQVVITNEGEVATPVTQCRVFLSPNAKVNKSRDTKLSLKDVKALEPGESVTMKFGEGVKEAKVKKAKHTIAVVDYDNRVEESDESNEFGVKIGTVKKKDGGGKTGNGKKKDKKGKKGGKNRK